MGGRGGTVGVKSVRLAILSWRGQSLCQQASLRVLDQFKGVESPEGNLTGV